MTLDEIIADINRQLDIARDSTVTFSRDDSFKLMTLLTILKNLQRDGQDKTIAQAAAMQAQHIDDLMRERAKLVSALEAAMILTSDMLDEILALHKHASQPLPLKLLESKDAFDRTMEELLKDDVP